MINIDYMVRDTGIHHIGRLPTVHLALSGIAHLDNGRDNAQRLQCWHDDSHTGAPTPTKMETDLELYLGGSIIFSYY